jgi:transaldolase
MKKVEDLKIKIFSDGADKKDMLEMNSKTFIKGLTTNPSLMKKAGIKDYETFAKDILSTIKEKPISFEVFSDDFDDMEKQAMEIASWAANVYVKIPITNTKKESSKELVQRLAKKKVKLNITAIMTLDQVKTVLSVLDNKVPSVISVFAGRIADTGKDPIPLMKECLKEMKINPKSELLWASPRELLNIIQADQIGCHIITVTKDIIKKLQFIDYDLKDYSLDTVKIFYKDAVDAGFKIN